MTLNDIQLTAAAAVTSHAVFAHFEPLPQFVIALYAVGSTALTFYLKTHRGLSFLQAAQHTSLVVVIYTATLLTSIGIYRLFFHRLSKFRGPTAAALSKWSLVPVDLAGRRPHYIHRLHAQFGDIVRTGPRELSINDPDAIPLMFGASSSALKGPWYAGIHAGLPKRSLSLHATVDPKDHAARRRIWDLGFKVRALDRYKPQLTKLTTSLMLRFEELAGKEINLDEWFNFLSFDMMSSIGFSSNTDLITKGELSRPIHLLEKALEMLMVINGVSYMAHLARYLPNPVLELEKETMAALEDRMGRGTNEPDIMSHLLGEDKETGWKHTKEELNSECGLLIVAGSDTTALSLAMAGFELTRNPQVMDRLAKEVDEVFGSEPAEDFDKLAKQCPYLNAFINEVFRLHPPVMSGLQRVTPPEGLVFKNQVIPGNTIVTVPTYSLHRDERNFSNPNEFLPERWLPDFKGNHNSKALNTFSYGPTSCIGKGLATMEMRSVIASFAQLFTSSFAPDFNPDGWPERCLLDVFTVKKAEPIRVILKLRPDRKRRGA